MSRIVLGLHEVDLSGRCISSTSTGDGSDCCLEGGSADFVEQSFVADFGKVGALDFCRDTNEGLSQGIFGSSVDHLLLDLGIVGRPGEETDLVSLAGPLFLKLKVVDGVSAFSWRQLGDKVVVRGRGRGVLHHDLGVGIVESVDNVLDLLSQLELLELRQTLSRDSDTGRLYAGVSYVSMAASAK